MTPTLKKTAKQYLVGKGFVKGGGGFLGMLASIGVPLALDLVRKIIGEGMQTQPPPPHHHEQDDHQEYQKVKGCKFNLHLFMELGMIIIV